MSRLLRILPLLASALVAGCASLPNRDPLNIDVAGIEPIPTEGLELRLSVRIRIQNPNNFTIEYSGAALDLELNGRRLASGVSDSMGTVPRYGETIVTIPVTISAFNVARQLMGFMNNPNPERVTFSVNGKLDGGLFATYRFSDEGSIELGRGSAF